MYSTVIFMHSEDYIFMHSKDYIVYFLISCVVSIHRFNNSPLDCKPALHRILYTNNSRTKASLSGAMKGEYHP